MAGLRMQMWRNRHYRVWHLNRACPPIRELADSELVPLSLTPKMRDRIIPNLERCAECFPPKRAALL